MKTGRNLNARIARLERRVSSRSCQTCEARPSLFWWSYFADGEEPASYPADRPLLCPGCGRQVEYRGLAIGFAPGFTEDERWVERFSGPWPLIRRVFGNDFPLRQTTTERRARMLPLQEMARL